MIIRHLHIDNFGCFHNFDLELEPELNRFVWENESGKSTLLEFIRRIFWGFPDKRSKLNPLPPLKGSGIYGGFLDVTLNDGTPLRLERRGEKGKLKIISQEGSVEQVSDIGPLAGISEIFYRNVCAVTLDEVTAFAALDDPEIRNRLYGNALSGGGVSLSELQEQLSSEAEKIFKKRGIHNLLKQLSADFDASEKRLAETAAAMPAYEKAVLAAEEMEKKAAAIREEIKKLSTQITDAKKIREIEERRLLLEKDENEFSRRSVPEPVPDLMGPFSETPPEVPAPPEYPAFLAPPEKPERSFLENKCDLQRASKADDKSISEALDYLESLRSCRKKASSLLLWGGMTFCLLLLIAGVVLSFGHPLPGGAAVAGGIAGLAALLVTAGKIFSKLAELKKKKADMIFRFSLNPALDEEELPELLKLLAVCQAEDAVYEQKLAQFEERKNRIETLRQEYETRRRIYDVQCAEFIKRRETYDKARLANEEKCRSAAVALARYEAEKLSLIKRRNELAQLMSTQGTLPADAPPVESLEEKLFSLEKELEENMKLSGAERREAALLLKGRDSSAELNVREQLRGRMRSAAERYLILSGARVILERAVERSERERQPELLRKSSKFLARMTENAYTRVYKSVTDNLLKISAADSPEGKNISQLSRGTREQLFLSLRLALIDSFDESTEALPIVFDDILVNFDRRRRSSALRTLEEFAQKRQVIIFECQ